MNNHLLHPEFAIATQAVEQFREATGLDILRITGAENGRDLQVINQLRQSKNYTVIVKRMVDRYATLTHLQEDKSDHPTLLVCLQMTQDLAKYCKAIGQQFIDTAGNAYITDGKDLLILVAGRKVSSNVTSSTKSIMTPAAARLAFAYLSDAALLNAPYRTLASALNMSVGAVSTGIEALTERGFVGTSANGKRVLLSHGRLLEEWTSGYLARIRPKFQAFRFSTDNIHTFEHYPIPTFPGAAWGGEKAADIITKHLKPERYTIYMDLGEKNELDQIVKACRLRADANGNIEIIQPFWKMSEIGTDGKTVPLPVVYADLAGSLDTRNLTVASEIYERIMRDAIDT